MADPSSASTAVPAEDQDRLLDAATATVKEQAYYMRRAMESDNLRDALKYASNLICEMRTSLLTPRNYYELYMRVFQEMQHLSAFFGERGRHGRKMSDLYESVQHAGNILPRLYLLVTVAGKYIESKDAPAKDILMDVNELCKGVQHPVRGLFLRYYLSQMVKDKLPDTGSLYEGEGGNIEDAFDFIFSNFCESNSLWCRMQQQKGTITQGQKREKERHDLRVLVGTNLVRLSQLDGMTVEYYARTALPRLLEHVLKVQDTISQQYLFESMIQVFPDEFHIRTLEQLLEAFTKSAPSVDMKPIMVTLMTRLANYLTNTDEKVAFAGIDIFSLFHSHLQQILERAPDPPMRGSSAPPLDVTSALEVQAVFLQFVVSLYPEKVHYVDIILGCTSSILRTYFARNEEAGLVDSMPRKLSAAAEEKVIDLLMAPLKSLAMGVLHMEHYRTLLGFLDIQARKAVATAMVDNILEADRPLTTVDSVQSLFQFISPLLKDEKDTPEDEGTDAEAFVQEQQQVCRLVHQIRAADVDTAFQVLSAMRRFFGEGGLHRLAYTLVPIFYFALSLIPTIQELDWRRSQGEDLPQPNVTSKRVLQFAHKTCTTLVQAAPQTALQMWLFAAAEADRADRALEPRGVFQAICNEFVSQGLICLEDAITESSNQFAAIQTLVGTLTRIDCLSTEEFDALAQKTTQHAARLLKKPMRCRAVAACSHLFWCEARKDGKRVLECLQRCLKIADTVERESQVGLWVDMFDKYVFFYEAEVPEVTPDFVRSLLRLCKEHISYALRTESVLEAQQAQDHLEQSTAYLRLVSSATDDQRLRARFAHISQEGDDCPPPPVDASIVGSEGASC